jgi:hypothetical protein
MIIAVRPVPEMAMWERVGEVVSPTLVSSGAGFEVVVGKVKVKRCPDQVRRPRGPFRSPWMERMPEPEVMPSCGNVSLRGVADGEPSAKCPWSTRLSSTRTRNE